jgi:DMSO/TMAO reductase YedYZ molybdopterin-dependent catalytic subunit
MLRLFALLLLSSLCFGQTLRVSGDVSTPLLLTPDQFAALPQATVEWKTERGAVGYQGVWLHELLKKAGVPSGHELRGAKLASYLVAKGADGYRVVFSVAELNPEVGGSTVLVARAAGAKPLGEKEGPYRLVVASDKRASRSVRMLTELQVVLLKQ